MANFIENLGLDFLTETEDQIANLWSFIAQNGKGITGYYGSPYLNYHFGDAQFILRTVINHDTQHIEVSGMDTHSSGICVWDVRISGMNITRTDADIMERRCVVHRANDGGGMAVVNIVNADVLPSYDEGEIIKLQMIAFPTSIDYFKNEDEYAKAQPKSRTGKSFLLANGAMAPIGLMHNRDPKNDDYGSDDNLDDLMLIRGTVKALYIGEIALNDQKDNAYIRCIIETEHGDLEIIHTIDEVKEEQRSNIRVGSVVSGIFVLSGDPAIYEYENGIVLDEVNNMSILRSTLAGADAERIRRVFAEDAIYYAEYNDATYSGRDAIIDRLKFVAKAPDKKFFAHLATITSVDEGDESLAYGKDKRCIVIASGSEDNYDTIAFIEMNDEGYISKLVTSTNPRYHFSIDTKINPKSPFDDIEFPKSVIEPIINRARFHGIIDDTITNENILDNIDDSYIFNNNIKQLLASMPDGNTETMLKNMFGYLFAKAVELTYTNGKQEKSCTSGNLISYSPSDVWKGEIRTYLDGEQHNKIVSAMDLGKQFAKDFAFFHPLDEPHNEDYDSDLFKALIVVQQLGKLYEDKYMAEE
ncbi:MAG: nuclear transport factor 2 family protein [Clostridia bacterium]|nr:nuclear transport factor 2 family protein [Clostridia bacterium]